MSVDTDLIWLEVFYKKYTETTLDDLGYLFGQEVRNECTKTEEGSFYFSEDYNFTSIEIQDPDRIYSHIKIKSAGSDSNPTVLDGTWNEEERIYSFTIEQGTTLVVGEVSYATQWYNLYQTGGKIFLSDPHPLSEWNSITKLDNPEISIEQVKEGCYINSYGDMTFVSKEVWKNLGVLTKIPYYYITKNNKNYQLKTFSYKNNRSSSFSSDDPSGYYMNKWKIDGVDSGKSEYWSAMPHIYPEIVFNNTDDMILPPSTISWNDGGLVFTWENGETSSYTINSDDQVVVFHRIGEVYPQNEISTFWHPTPDTDYNRKRNIELLQLSTELKAKINTYVAEEKFDNWNPVAEEVPSTFKKIETDSQKGLVRTARSETSPTVQLYVKGVSAHMGEGEGANVFQIGTYDGYNASDWRSHCSVQMTLWGLIEYVSIQTKTFSEIINYKTNYDSTIAQECNKNGDMVALITVNYASLHSQCSCNPGTLPFTIPFYKTQEEKDIYPTSYNPTNYKFWSIEYEDGTYCGKAKHHFEGPHGNETTAEKEYSISMFIQNNYSCPAIAVVIWRNGKLLSED